MTTALTVVSFLLFTIGVFVDGEELVSVTEGDSVTFKSGVTEIQTDDAIKWTHSGRQIAKLSSDIPENKPDGSFKHRLQLDKKTGDLTISNIRTTDSGEYKVKVSSPGGSPEMTFNVSETLNVIFFLCNSVIYYSILSEHICTIMRMSVDIF